MNSFIEIAPFVFGPLSIFMAIIFAWKSPKGTFRSFFSQTQNKTVESILIGFSALTIAFSLTTLLGRHFPHPEQAEYAEFSKMVHDPIGFAVTVLLALFFAPISEELIFRGYLINGFQKFLKMVPGSAILVSALLFAFSHSTHPQIISLICFAGILGILRVRSLSLRATVLTHVLNNAIGMAMIFWSPNRPNDWISSGILFVGTVAFLKTRAWHFPSSEIQA